MIPQTDKEWVELTRAWWEGEGFRVDSEFPRRMVELCDRGLGRPSWRELMHERGWIPFDEIEYISIYESDQLYEDQYEEEP